MKKLVKVLLAVALAATMLFALAACGNSPEGYYTLETITEKKVTRKSSLIFPR